jgi:hypothetical protein
MSDQTARLGIMSADDFKNRTKATKEVCGFSSHFKSRGSSMTSIDSSLASYDAIYKSGKGVWDEYQRANALVAIKYACQQYLADKSSKSSALSGHRQGVVKDLLKATETALAYVKTRAKGTAKAKDGSRPTTGLKPGYKLERDHYEQQGKKQNPYSASAMHDGENDPSGMNLSQFTAAGNAGNVSTVQFMNRGERLEYLVVVKDGLLSQGGQPLKCDAGAGVIFSRTYAIDRYGNLFSKMEAVAPNRALRFNHSSYCAGKEILCAGTLACDNGRLVYVSNLSGHYKPDASALSLALIVLGEEGVDLDNVAVNARGAAAGWCKGSTFVTHKDASPADWPHKVDRGAYGVQWKVNIGGQDCRVSDPT